MAFYTVAQHGPLEWVTSIGGKCPGITVLARQSQFFPGGKWHPETGTLEVGEFRPATDTEILAAKLMGDYV